MGVVSEKSVPRMVSLAVTSREPADPVVALLMDDIAAHVTGRIDAVEVVTVYDIEASLDAGGWKVARECLVDPVLEKPTDHRSTGDWTWVVEIRPKHGVTDTLGRTAQTAIEDEVGTGFGEGPCVTAWRQVRIRGAVSFEEVSSASTTVLGNPLIEDIVVEEGRVAGRGAVEFIDLEVNDARLASLSKERQLALDVTEMKAIAAHYRREDVRRQRIQYGLPGEPTDVEIEALAQTWSEHCKHKIFNATIRYDDGERQQTVDGLFKTCIRDATSEVEKECDWLVSLFTDNAGIVKFDEGYNIAFKVETHNSPSALDPYGGALTGILGVNRDILGAGLGARLVANTDVFCFAPPEYSGELPERLMHPARVMEGVRRGVEHGGNKSGVPTVNGSLVYDERYLGKPLVYCGTVGIIPAQIDGVDTAEKTIVPGDLAVVVGGRTGKDGIHGATFSSEALHADSPTSAVQIGDPFTQKKVGDLLLEARDRLLYRCVTDNGAGGLSSSIGELAELSGGCEIDLELVTRKYPGMQPWEVLVSESQERMTLAVDPSCWPDLEALAAEYEVEVAAVGRFTDSGLFHVRDEGSSVALLSLEFLHDGVPTMQLAAEWRAPLMRPVDAECDADIGDELHQLLGRLNICSKESVVRQFDHEVQGGTVVKPLVGVNCDGPSDAAVVVPDEVWGRSVVPGIAIGHGICPRYSDLDCYAMAACAIDEAIRNTVAVGADPQRIAILDNFCWPDPVYNSEYNPDGKLKLAQLVRACHALRDVAVGMGTPIISGKDSMKNDYRIGDVKISVPPTLLISAVGRVADVTRSVTMDAKAVGDVVYLLGTTRRELGGSEYLAMRGVDGGRVPTVDIAAARYTYRQLHRAMAQGIVASCHDCSDGGLAVAVAETAFSGGYGIEMSLLPVLQEGTLTDREVLFSESPSRLLVTVPPQAADAFDVAMVGCQAARIGRVVEAPHLRITGKSGEVVLDEGIEGLRRSWQRRLPKKAVVGGAGGAR